MAKDIKRPDPKIAEQALEEAAQRRALEKKKQIPKELGGRDGPDPARFGDWENKGITSDF